MSLKTCKFEVIGTNKLTNKLIGTVFTMPNFVISDSNHIATTKIDGEDFTFEIKEIYFIDGDVVLAGFVSDSSMNVGRISLKYLS